MNDERKMVLKMLEDGKISVDEAERLLHALHAQPEENTEEEQEPLDSDEPLLPSEFVDWDRWEERKQTYEQESSGFKISQYVENFIQKIKDVDFDLNFGPYEQVNHIYQDHSVDFQELNIQLKNGSIELTPWNDTYVQVDCDVEVYRVQSSDEARRRFLSEVYFEIANGTLVLTCDARDVKVNATINIPQKLYELVECKLFNGTMSGDAVQTKELYAKTVNGSMTFPQLRAQKANLETGNGTVTLSGVANILEIETINGAIEAKGAFRDFVGESFSGAITAHLQSDGNVSLKSTTSGITVVVANDMQVHGELASSIGGVHCELHSFEVLHEKQEFAQRHLMFVSNKKAAKMLRLEASTRTGTVTVTEQEG